MGKNLALRVIAITQWELLLFEIEVRNEEMAVVVLGAWKKTTPAAVMMSQHVGWARF